MSRPFFVLASTFFQLSFFIFAQDASPENEHLAGFVQPDGTWHSLNQFSVFSALFL